MPVSLVAAPRDPLAETTSYDPRYFAALVAVEDRHFWFRARNRVIATLTRQIVAVLPAGYRVLEVGCGNGNVLRFLAKVCRRGTVVGMDLFYEGLAFARQRVSCPLVQGDMHRPPFEAGFQVVGLFDVLEHLPDDVQVLRDIHRMLADNGLLFLTVPAHPALWSYFDEASHHCRRYTEQELRGKLLQAGYEVEYLTPYMATIFPMMWLGRRLAGLRRRSARQGERIHELSMNELAIVPVLNDLLSFILGQEGRWLARRRRLPMGTSLLALARKK